MTKPTSSALRVRPSILAIAAATSLGIAVPASADTWRGGFYRFGQYDVEGTDQSLSLRDYVMAVTVPQWNAGYLEAVSAGVSTGVMFGQGSSVQTTQAGNRITALATANQADSRIDAALAGSAGEGADGLGILTGQVRRDASTRSTVVDAAVATMVQDLAGGEHSVTGNLVSARTTLNQSAAAIAGALPAHTQSYDDARVSSSIGFGTMQPLRMSTLSSLGLEADTQSSGTLNVGTAQMAVNAGQRAGSAATVDNARVTVDLVSGYGYGDVDSNSYGFGYDGKDVPSGIARLALTGNELSAQYEANRSANLVQSQAAGASFAGGVAVHNMQANVERGDYGMDWAGPTASVRDTTVRATVGGEGYAPALSGAIAVSGNRVAAASTGNNATGNTIDLAGAADLAGRNGSRWNHGAAYEGSLGSQVGADLAVSNVQSNDGAFLGSEVSRSQVGAATGGITSSGAISVTGNTVDAGVVGSIAANRIGAQASRIGATAAAANVQSGTDTVAVAGTQDVRIGAGATGNTGYGDYDGYGYGYGQAISGTTTVADNAVAARAAGNVADTQVALAATHLANGATPAFSMGGGWGYAAAAADGAASASNLQIHQGGYVGADLSANAVGVKLGGGWEGNGTSVQGASVSVARNTLRSQAQANDAATGVSLQATTGATSAAVSNVQGNATEVRSEAYANTVRIEASRVIGSSLALDGNTIGAAAGANRAVSRIDVRVDQLQPMSGQTDPDLFFSPSGSEGGAGAQGMREGGSAAGQFALGSVQQNAAGVEARNVTSGIVAKVDAPYWSEPYGTAYTDVGYADGLAGSSVAVRGNQLSAAGTGNVAANTLAMNVGQATASYGGALGAVANVQTEATESRSSATLRREGRGLLIGAELEGGVWGSQVAVTGNTASASSLGNQAANRIEANATDLASQASWTDLRAGFEGGMVRNDLALLNQQSAQGAGRTASTQGVRIGVQADSGWWSGIGGSAVTVSDNLNLAEARNNDAANSIAITATNLSAGGGLLNQQDSAARVRSSADGSMRIDAGDTSVEGSSLALTGNATQAMAIGNAADNAFAVQATSIRGNGVNQAWWYDDVPTALSTSASYAVGNLQNSQASVKAAASATNRIRTDGMYGANAAVTGNQVAGVAQANSATSTLELSATQIDGATAAIASVQNASGRVRASADGEFTVEPYSTYGTQLTVSDNRLRASAGQNEAFNTLRATAASIAPTRGATFGDYDVYQSDLPAYSVSNEQNGSGNVRATARPGTIGVQMDSAYGGSLAVTGNEVGARAAVNTASNGLSLAAQGMQAAGGTVSNAQTTGDGAVQAIVGGHRAPVMVGVSGSALNGTPVAVTGNSLNAAASGNGASNVLNASGVTTGANAPTFSVLNSQSNAAGMQAVVQNAAIGATAAGWNYDSMPSLLGNGYGYGWGLNGANASVSSNSVSATGYGNTATNAIQLGAQQGSAGATAAVNNRQVNTGGVSAVVQGVAIGVQAQGAYGTGAVVNGNAISAQAIGNASVNSIGIK